MKGNRFSEEQIVGMLREHEAGPGPRRCAGATGSQARRPTSMDGKKFRVLVWG